VKTIYSKYNHECNEECEYHCEYVYDNENYDDEKDADLCNVMVMDIGGSSS
jgi:hypothetical protein